MAALTIPLENGLLYEIIVSTYDADGKSNAAPMGLFYRDNSTITIKIFKTAKTYSNLLLHNCCIANISSDPELFTKCVLFKEEITEDYFVACEFVSAPILKQCENNYLALELVRVTETPEGNVAIFNFKIIHSEFSSSITKPYSRAFSSLLEILIHTTRILSLSESNDFTKKIKIFYNLIEHHFSIIQRVTTSDTLYQELLHKIKNKIDMELVKLHLIFDIK